MLRDADSFRHVYIACGKTDLRRGMDSLLCLIRNEFRLDTFAEGAIFLFCGSRLDRMKALVFEGDGVVLTQQRFGRKTEKTREMVDGQLSFSDLENGELVLNEAEACLDAGDGTAEEAETALEESLRRERRKRKPGKQKERLGNLELRVEEHTLTEAELKAGFPEGYRRLPDDVTTTLEYVPAWLKVKADKK